MSSNLPAIEPSPPSFDAAMGEAADAAIRQGIPCAEAIGPGACAIEALYAAAGLPTPLDKLEADFAAYRARWGDGTEAADEQVA